MLFKRKNTKINNKQHNFNISSLKLPHISTSELIFNQYLLKKAFVWADKQIHIIDAKEDILKKAEHYIALHTEQGIFYIHNGISWLQKLTSIYIAHEDEDTQNWLLERALEALPKDAFPLLITNLSFHHYININKYNALYLNGFSSKILYASTENWIKLFKKYKFIRKHNFSVDNLEIQKNILLGRQKLQYTDYKKLVCGNIILINEHYFNLDGTSNIEIGKFSMSVAYSDNTLIFHAWNNNMNDKPYTENQDNNEEWNQDEALLANEYNETDESFNQLEDNTELEAGTEEQNYEEDHIPAEQGEENLEEISEDEPHPFANVPVHLTFSLGTLRMPIANIMQLQEGSVIELHKTTPAQVTIYANSKLIGTGEVIEIDGKLGVQINKLEKD